MRIRGRKTSSDNSVSLSQSPSSSSSSYSSSITAAHSLASSQDSSNSSPFSASHRCHGLDLLVKAIHQVTAGSVVGVPYIQRRVTIRRRRRSPGLGFEHFSFDDFSGRKREMVAKDVNSQFTNKKMKTGKNLGGLPSKIEDSVLQSWRRRSGHADEIGL